MNYFEILSPPAPCAIAGSQTNTLERYARKQEVFARTKSQWTFWSLLQRNLDMLTYHHFGDPMLLDRDEITSSASKLIKQFYTTSWYADDPYESEMMRKEKGNREFAWYRYFKDAFIVALLTGQQETITLLADYTESWFDVESMVMPVDPVWGKIYVSVAASFRSKPLDGHVEMEDSIRRDRKTAPKLLFRAWEAARAGDREEFEKHLRNSVILFEKKLPEDLCNVDELIAFPESTVLAAARRLGVPLPSYEPRIMARLLTTESVGFKQK